VIVDAAGVVEVNAVFGATARADDACAAAVARWAFRAPDDAIAVLTAWVCQQEFAWRRWNGL
jgi:hypothetical protein